MASRQVEGRRVDLGASYLTVSDDRFAAVVERWQAAGLARPWTDTFDVREADGSLAVEVGPGALGRPPGPALPGRAPGRGPRRARRDRRRGRPGRRVEAGPRVDGRAASAVVLAMPDPQARRLLAPTLEDVAAAPRRPVRPDPRADGGVGRADTGTTTASSSTAATCSRGWPTTAGAEATGLPVLVAHSTPDVARDHLADPDRRVRRARRRAARGPGRARAEARRGAPLDLRQALRVAGEDLPAHRRRDRLLRRRVVARRRRSKRVPVRAGARGGTGRAASE